MMTIKDLKKNSLLFVCSPNLGIIDSWLPVLWELKKQAENSELVCVFPISRSIDEINPDNILIRLAAQVFDKFVFRTPINEWMIAENLTDVGDLNRISANEKRLNRMVGKMERIPLLRFAGRLINRCYRFYRAVKYRENVFSWSKNRDKCKGILYDVYAEDKSHNNEIMKHLHHLPKFSICHGLNIKNGGVIKATEEDRRRKKRKDVTAYIFTEKVRPFYKIKFGIPDDAQQVVGIPRHDPEWIDFLKKQSKEMKNDPGQGYIFVLSRPYGSIGHPKHRRLQSLEEIKELAWTELNRKIVVKLHPKEKTTIYDEVFGGKHYGKKWCYSNLHPFVLGEQCLFAISFFSGVPIDLIVRGVPCIERLDLRGIPECDHKDSLRDKKGEPVKSFRYLGLVLGASTYESMKQHAESIINNREEVVIKLKKRYNELYPDIKQVNQKIAGDILSKI